HIPELLVNAFGAVGTPRPTLRQTNTPLREEKPGREEAVVVSGMPSPPLPPLVPRGGREANVRIDEQSEGEYHHGTGSGDGHDKIKNHRFAGPVLVGPSGRAAVWVPLHASA